MLHLEFLFSCSRMEVSKDHPSDLNPKHHVSDREADLPNLLSMQHPPEIRQAENRTACPEAGKTSSKSRQLALQEPLGGSKKQTTPGDGSPGHTVGQPQPTRQDSEEGENGLAHLQLDAVH